MKGLIFVILGLLGCVLWIMEAQRLKNKKRKQVTRYRDLPPLNLSNVETQLNSELEGGLPDGTASADEPSSEELPNIVTYHHHSLLQTLKGHNDSVNAVAFSPSGRALASGSDGADIIVWDLETGQPTQTLAEHTAKVTSVDFSPDGLYLASASADKSVRLWDLGTGTCIAMFDGYSGTVNDARFSPDGRYLVTQSGLSLQMWDLAEGSRVPTRNTHEYETNSVAFSPAGPVLAVGTKNAVVELWDMENAEIVDELVGSVRSGPVVSLAFSPDGTLLATGSINRVINVWNAQTGKRGQTIKGTVGHFTTFSSHKLSLAAWGKSKLIELWNADSGTYISALDHGDMVNGAAFSPDGTCLASAGADGCVKIWSFITKMF